MSARTQLAADLKTGLPTYPVVAYDPTLDVVRKPTLMLWQDYLTRPERLALSAVQVNLILWVLVGIEDPAKADDALDTALEDVLFALEPIAWVQWEKAERGIFAERFHGYKVTLTAMAAITPNEGD